MTFFDARPLTVEELIGQEFDEVERRYLESPAPECAMCGYSGSWLEFLAHECGQARHDLGGLAAALEDGT